MSSRHGVRTGRRGSSSGRALRAPWSVALAAVCLALLMAMATAPSEPPTSQASPVSVTRPAYAPAALWRGSVSGAGSGASATIPGSRGHDLDASWLTPVAWGATFGGQLATPVPSQRGTVMAVPLAASAPVQFAPVPTPIGSVRVPGVLWTAYARAVAEVRASCHLPVSLLAAIGHVESRSLAGRSLTVSHDVVPSVLGPVLSGGAFAAIRDTDAGRWDGDRVWDRAVGPMQFIPGTWRVWGRDGNGDGVANPQNVEDAALSAATYLCVGGRDLSDPAQLRAAVLSYNNSSSYAAAVLGLMGSMGSGGAAGPGAVGPAVRVTVTAPPVTVTAKATVTVRAEPSTPPARTLTVTATQTATQTVVVTVTAPASTPATSTTTTTTAPAGKGASSTSSKTRAAVSASSSSPACGAGSAGATTGTPAPPSMTGC